MHASFKGTNFKTFVALFEFLLALSGQQSFTSELKPKLKQLEEFYSVMDKAKNCDDMFTEFTFQDKVDAGMKVIRQLKDDLDKHLTAFALWLGSMEQRLVKEKAAPFFNSVPVPGWWESLRIIGMNCIIR